MNSTLCTFLLGTRVLLRLKPERLLGLPFCSEICNPTIYFLVSFIFYWLCNSLSWLPFIQAHNPITETGLIKTHPNHLRPWYRQKCTISTQLNFDFSINLLYLGVVTDVSVGILDALGMPDDLAMLEHAIISGP